LSTVLFEILSQLAQGARNTEFIYRQLLTISDWACCIALDAERDPDHNRMESTIKDCPHLSKSTTAETI
jgi:hypothetical protein